MAPRDDSGALWPTGVFARGLFSSGSTADRAEDIRMLKEVAVMDIIERGRKGVLSLTRALFTDPAQMVICEAQGIDRMPVKKDQA